MNARDYIRSWRQIMGARRSVFMMPAEPSARFRGKLVADRSSPNPRNNQISAVPAFAFDTQSYTRFGTFDGLRLPWPIDPSALFGRSAPLIMEIGFGGGTFLRDLAARHPEANVIGVEHSHHCLSDVERALAKHPLPNLRLIHSDALVTLGYVCGEAWIDALHINFPDPFPKNSHVDRRLLSPFSLALIASRLRPGAALHIATDVAAYARSIAEDLAATPGLRSRHPTPWLTAVPGRTVTRYERKAQDRGITCHYFEWERTTGTPPPVAIPDQPADFAEEVMPNIVLHSPLTLDAIAAAFQPSQHLHEGIHVHLLEMYQNHTHHGLLIDTFVDEPLIEQRPGIAIAEHEHEPHRYIVRLAPLGHPRPTRGVHVAVSLIADWVSTLHPDTEIVYRHVQS